MPWTMQRPHFLELVGATATPLAQSAQARNGQGAEETPVQTEMGLLPSLHVAIQTLPLA